MKRIILAIAVLLCVPMLRAQSWDEIRSQTEVFISGEGFGETVQEADERALADLISQISVVVSKDVTVIDDELVENGNYDAHSYTASKIQSYSEATLNNTERLIISNEPDAHVVRFIKRAEIDKIFDSRKMKVKEHVRLAQMAEAKGKVDDALRNYYWAFSLLKTLPTPNSVTDDKGHVLVSWIPQQMNEVFDDIKVSVVKIDGINVDLYFSFRGKPIASIDYTYFDGRDWSNIYSAKDGRGVLELLSGVETQNVQLKYEYAYRGQAHIDHELEAAMKVVKGKAMRKSYANISLESALKAAKVEDAAPVEESVPTMDIAPTNSGVSFSLVKDNEAARYQTIVDDVVKAIKAKKYATAEKHFTPEGVLMYRQLISYGKARVLDYSRYQVSRLGNRTIVRSVPMSFSFERGVRKSFVEDVVFTFDSVDKIECVAFGLDQEAMADVEAKTVWPEEARQALISFLENYKTAYALKRLDYLQSIFDDNAVIIIGHVVKRFERQGDSRQYANNTYVQRSQISKAQYLKNLEACFRSNEFVNIRFANNDIIKAGGSMGETYGIQIKQDYYSTHYGDKGYLYLQVDMNDPDNPIIKVRTWQEEPDPEIGRPYGMQDF